MEVYTMMRIDIDIVRVYVISVSINCTENESYLPQKMPVNCERENWRCALSMPTYISKLYVVCN